MGDERYPRNSNPQGDHYGRQDQQDHGRDYGSGRDDGYSSSRNYGASGDRGRDQGRGAGYGSRGYSPGDQDRGGGQQRYGQSRDTGYSGEDRGSYASDGRHFEDVGNQRHRDDDYYRDPDARSQPDRNRQSRDYGRQPQGYNYDERGFAARAGDEVRSWFGDDDAERRREQDARHDERQAGSGQGHHHDHDYHGWRQDQISALDRDYDEYRQENRSKFHSEFGAWREKRQGQRDMLKKVDEHMEVVGSDGSHVGTIDKVRGDRILLTKNDQDAGGRHHSFPSSWIDTVDTRVTLSKSADDAKAHWKDEERSQAMFGDDPSANPGDQQTRKAGDDTGGHMLNRSFSGTY